MIPRLEIESRCNEEAMMFKGVAIRIQVSFLWMFQCLCTRAEVGKWKESIGGSGCLGRAGLATGFRT